MGRKPGGKMRLALLAAAACAGVALAQPAAAQISVAEGVHAGALEVPINKSQVIRADRPYSKALISAIPLPDPKAERARERVMLHGDLPSPLNPPKGCRFCTRCPMAQEVCHSTEPPLIPRSDGRLVACHFV